MDIHRCRFVPYEASAINAIAISHPHLSTSSKARGGSPPVRLAIGRANGDIEIWNPLQGTWLHEVTIPGGQDRSIEGLAWVVGDDEELDAGGGKTVVSQGRLRLFSIGYTNTVTEWDLESARAKRHATGQHGEIWCLATQPKPPAGGSSIAQHLVGGTVDGSLVLYATADDDLLFTRVCRVHKKNVRVVSLTFQTPQHAVAGCSDGTIRVFDLRTGAVLQAMTLGRDLAGGAKDVIVWTVRCLPNGDIVSGDSTGQVCIWDGHTYTQAQRLQSHTQDVLSLAVSADGSTVVSGGMDRRVVLHRELARHGGRWAKVWHRRYHRHDVKAMAAYESKDMSVVVAGGPDATPVVLPLQKSGMEHHRTLSHLPQTVPVASAPQARLVICWWNREVQIWGFETSASQLLGEAESGADLERNRRLVGRLLIKGESNITSAAISADGSLVIVATNAAVKAFHLRKSPSDELVISKVLVPPSVAFKSANNVAISPNGRWVCVACGVENYVTLLEIHRERDEYASPKPSFGPTPTRLRRLKRPVQRYELFGGLGRYDRRITQIAFSPDSKMLATGDLAGYIDTWILRGADGSTINRVLGNGNDEGRNDDAESTASSEDEDSDAEDSLSGDGMAVGVSNDRWIRNPLAKQLVKLSSAPMVLSFAPDVPEEPALAGSVMNSDAGSGMKTRASDYVLLVITATSHIFAFHPLQAKLVTWKRLLRWEMLPLAYRNLRDTAKGVLWQGPRLWIYGASFLFMLDTSVEPPVQKIGGGEDAAQTNGLPPQRKRKRGDDSGAGGKMTQGPLAPQRVQLAVQQEDGEADGGASGWMEVEMEVADKSKRGLLEEGDGDDDDDDDDDDSDEDEEQEKQADETVREGQNGETQLLRKEQEQQQVTPQPRRWWHSSKYRPILGVVPLSAADRSPSSSSSSSPYPPLEVALVEQPGWDVELPERYDTDER